MYKVLKLILLKVGEVNFHTFNVKEGMICKMKRLGLFCFSLLIIVFLNACGDSNSGDGVTLELWTTWTEDRPENTIYKEKIEEFNEEHSDIKIEHKGIPNDDIETKLRTQATADELPDMFKGYPGERMQSFIDAEQVMPIDSIMDNWEGKIPDDLLDEFNFDGKQYAITGNVSVTSLIYYHKDMLDDVGYSEFPDKYNDFKKLIKKLNESDTTPIAMGNEAPWVLQSTLFSSIGDRLTGSDFLEDALNGDAEFTDSRFVEALSIVDELNNLNTFNENLNTIDEEKSRSDFIEKKSAMHVAGSWALGPILDSDLDAEDIGVAPFPEIENGDGDPDKVAGTQGGGIYLNSDLSDEKKEAAETFLKFFYDDELYERLAEEADQLVPVDVNEDNLNELFVNVNDLTENGLAPVYDATLTPELTDEVNKGLQSITTDSITPEKLSEDMQKINEED